ncbi:hypothetical protein C922_02876 [Plasmodium inui San Antonio 1]|uniref:Plasmodium RESA N-terminal domain-containing protein n=1 Tax=Plasmodium inui San Antonio 1 TaxID=1237626 RepID=W7A570_9APIC|nr:hypothetical protein C922_02876 [Plasmodium inui San Antonio 1]EUD66890.1 hypothetical protein C922_02876 [Plasmodium inui San Antonio 1]
MYYKDIEWKSFSKLELSIDGCSRKLAEIEQLKESANLAREALKNEDSDDLRECKQEFYKRMEESMNQVRPNPSPAWMKKGKTHTTVKGELQFAQPKKTTQKGKTPNRNQQKEKDEKVKNRKEKDPVPPMEHSTKKKNKIMSREELKERHDEILYKEISEDEMDEIWDFIKASNYTNIQRSMNAVYNQDDNYELPYGCTMREISEKITENDLNLWIAKLPNVVIPRDMFIIWHYVQSFGRDKYLKMNGDLWRMCGHLQKEYNIPNDIKKREWLEVAGYLSSELLEKENNDSLEFKELVKKGFCTKAEFYKFIDNTRSSWNILTDIMMDSWKERLIERLKGYSIEKE